MAYEFLLPDIGEGVVEAEILKWFVKPGDPVVEDQPLAEVMTDKATVTIPSPKRGVVTRLLWKEGDLARVHHGLVEIEVEAGPSEVASVVALPKAAQPSAAPAVDRGAPVLPGTGKALATPAVRALAREIGVNLQEVQATGSGGRVTKDDVRAHAGPRGGAPEREARSGARIEGGRLPASWRSSRSGGCAGASPRRWPPRSGPLPISPSSSRWTPPSSWPGRKSWPGRPRPTG